LLLSLKALAADYHSIKLSFEAVGFPAIHPVFLSVFQLTEAIDLTSSKVVITKALYPLFL
jgi:hypothetical protein